jgi:O-antigen ligase
MLTIEIEKRLSTIICWGGLAVTLIVTDQISADPVNVGKMTVLAFCAGSALAILFSARGKIFQEFRLVAFSLIAFLSVAIVSIWASSNSWEKGFYGTYGRNTGLLTYTSLAIVFMALTQFYRIESYVRFIKIFIIAGFVNLVYCIVAAQGYDLFSWQNPYGKVLGTFGNPNFISSFMGLFVIGLLAIFCASGNSLFDRILIILLMLGSVYVIRETGSQQGALVALGGAVLVIYFFLQDKMKSKIFSTIYFSTFLSLGVVAVLGMLQKGPLSDLLYKQSVSLRGEYWQAGINMGLANPAFGVGLDSYGTFYRSFRRESATVIPGVDTVTDAAHNIFLDIFANLGIIGLFFYLFIHAIVLSNCIRYMKNHRNYDVVFVFLFSTWLGYQAQALISINQIGLAFWGWALAGALYGYTKIKPSSMKISKNLPLREVFVPKKKIKSSEVPAGIVVSTFMFGAVFFALAVPSFYADVVLRSAVKSNSPERMYASGTQFPVDSNRINFLASRLSGGGITEQSVSLVRLGIAKFPNDYGMLFSMFQLSAPNSSDRNKYGRKLHLADPYNPAFFEFK